MGLLEIYVYFGIPIIALLMGLRALWLTKPGATRAGCRKGQRFPRTEST